MRPEVIAAERVKEVRDAARAWRRAGFINEATQSAILALYSDDRERFGPGLRALAFIFAGFGSLTLVGLSLVLFEPRTEVGAGLHLLFWAAVLFIGTEWQRGPARRADAGAEAATAWGSACCAIAGMVLLGASFDGSGYQQILLRIGLATFAVSGVLAWHWGDRVFHAGAVISGFWLLAQSANGRLAWMVAGAVLIPICLRVARDGGRAPSFRRGSWIVGAAGVLALYAAVHIGSFDQRWIEELNLSNAAPTSPFGFRSLAILATALLPPTLLMMGAWRREPLLLYSGLVLIGVSIATIRLYHAVMPLSLALILIGAFCLALALGVRRWLRDGPAGERHGFTADPLFDDANRTEVVRTAVSMASFTPTAQATPSRPAFEGGGGQFGGGGATGGY